VLWLIAGAPEELEFLPGAKTQPDMSLIYPVDPKQFPKELAGVRWPPKSECETAYVQRLKLGRRGSAALP